MPEIQPIQRSYTLEVLSAEQLKEIREGTLHILEQVGVHFPSKRALGIFADHGAEVDRDAQMVRMPPSLVLEALSQAPRSFALSGRAEGTDLLLDGTRSYFGTDGCGTETVDFDSGAQRASRKEDVARMARVVDHLSSVAFYWPMVSAQDYGRLAPLHELEASFNNTVKHVQTETVMGEKHTRRHMRQIWLPELNHPGPPPAGESWPDIRRRARAKFDRILAEHRPEPLEDPIRAELKAMLEAAAAEW